MIRGKYSVYAFLHAALVLIFLIVSIYFLANSQHTFKGRTGQTYPGAAPGLLFLVLTSFLFYSIAKKIYEVFIDRDRIRLRGVFKSKIIERCSIKSINLFARDLTIAISIELENGEKWVISDPFYSNIHLLKQYLSANFADKINPLKVKRSSNLDKSGWEEDFEKIAGDPRSSVNGLLFIGAFVVLTFIFLSTQGSKQSGMLLFSVSFLVLLYFVFGSQLNYFLLSDKHLIVKNHFYFWRKKTYVIDDIVEANFESHPKRSISLRLTTADFRSRSYEAGSLRDYHRKRLRGLLENADILFI